MCAQFRKKTFRSNEDRIAVDSKFHTAYRIPAASFGASIKRIESFLLCVWTVPRFSIFHRDSSFSSSEEWNFSISLNSTPAKNLNSLRRREKKNKVVKFGCKTGGGRKRRVTEWRSSVVGYARNMKTRWSSRSFAVFFFFRRWKPRASRKVCWRHVFTAAGCFSRLENALLFYHRMLFLFSQNSCHQPTRDRMQRTT